MVDRGVVELDIVLSAPAFDRFCCKIGSVLLNDVVGHAVIVDHIGNEIINQFQVLSNDWLCLNPICKFVDHD